MCFSLTFVGWLVTRWSTLTDKGEIKEDTALHFAYSLVPYIKYNEMEQLLTVSYIANDLSSVMTCRACSTATRASIFSYTPVHVCNLISYVAI